MKVLNINRTDETIKCQLSWVWQFPMPLIYYVVELKGKVKWFDLIKPAGTSTLTCYLIPYVYYSLATYAFVLPAFLKTGAIGLIKSFVYALIIIGITAVLGRLKIRLKI